MLFVNRSEVRKAIVASFPWKKQENMKQAIHLNGSTPEKRDALFKRISAVASGSRKIDYLAHFNLVLL